MRTAGLGALIAAVTLVGAQLASASASPSSSLSLRAASGHPMQARLEGTFLLHGRITAANGPPGERRGERVKRTWTFKPRCQSGQCRHERLRRQRGRRGVIERLSLKRVGRGRYRGRSGFYGPLDCGGRRYRLGERVQFVISVQITRSVRIQQRTFATRIRASYRAVNEINRTPCVGVLGGDAAVYSGQLSSPLPSPPTARFTSSPTSPGAATISFQDASAPGRGGARITGWSWSFGDPASGSTDQSTLRDPVHTFSRPGTYAVSLTVRDTLGLTGSTQQPVAAP